MKHCKINSKPRQPFTTATLNTATRAIVRIRVRVTARIKVLISVMVRARVRVSIRVRFEGYHTCCGINR